MEYETVIGMEVHVELCTNSKVFCGCSTKFGAPPNSQVCPVCLGMPGVLPVLNRRALEFTLRTAIALDCEVAPVATFERKNYYYPDLPKNYQISQLRQNLGINGFLEIPLDGGTKQIGIDNVHLEEDAGKLVHPEGEGETHSLVDLNRAGVPLIEIVSKPDIRGSAEALAYMNTLKSLLQYIEISECKMQQGHVRFEANISIRPEGSDKLGPRVEIKNLNSTKAVVRSIEYELTRQAEVLREGEAVRQETRLWDDLAGESRTMRSKEKAHDYRYFPEPDLVPVHISREWLDEVRSNLPELRNARCARLMEQFDLSDYDATVLTESKTLADYYEQCLAIHHAPKATANWIMTELLRELNTREIEADEFCVTPRHLATLIRLIDEGTISGKIAKRVFADMVETAVLPEEIVKREGLVQVTDESMVEKWIDEVIASDPETAEAYRSGKDKALGRLVGRTMKLSQGKANPQLVNEMLRKRLRG